MTLFWKAAQNALMIYCVPHHQQFLSLIFPGDQLAQLRSLLFWQHFEDDQVLTNFAQGNAVCKRISNMVWHSSMYSWHLLKTGKRFVLQNFPVHVAWKLKHDCCYHLITLRKVLEKNSSKSFGFNIIPWQLAERKYRQYGWDYPRQTVDTGLIFAFIACFVCEYSERYLFLSKVLAGVSVMTCFININCNEISLVERWKAIS